MPPTAGVESYLGRVIGNVRSAEGGLIKIKLIFVTAKNKFVLQTSHPTGHSVPRRPRESLLDSPIGLGAINIEKGHWER